MCWGWPVWLLLFRPGPSPPDGVFITQLCSLLPGSYEPSGPPVAEEQRTAQRSWSGLRTAICLPTSLSMNVAVLCPGGRPFSGPCGARVGVQVSTSNKGWVARHGSLQDLLGYHRISRLPFHPLGSLARCRPLSGAWPCAGL